MALSMKHDTYTPISYTDSVAGSCDAEENTHAKSTNQAMRSHIVLRIKSLVEVT